MIKIILYENERIESAMRRFKKQCDKEGLIKDIRRSEFYEKPSERRNRKVRKMAKEYKLRNQEKTSFF